MSDYVLLALISFAFGCVGGQINDHRLALACDSEDLPDPWDFKQGVRAAERAHGIGGEA